MPCGGKSLLGTLWNFIFNFIGFGFVTSLYIHNNAQCSWQDGLTSDDSVSIFTLFLGTYFSIHVFTWYIVFVYLYGSVIAAALDYLLPYLNLCHRYERLLHYLFELLFGYWAAGEILGGWCDLERIGECIQNDTGDCQSFLINMATRTIQSLCERITSDYDEERNVFTRKPTNLCVYTFRYMGHFVMTTLSTLVTYTILF